MAHDVFISYATEDKSVANAVCKALEERGVRCWYAPRDIPYAVDYEEAIVDAISVSKLMVLVLSSHSNNSAHVKREVQNACKEEPPVLILPFQVENIILNRSLRYYIGSVHWLSALTTPLEDHLQSLVNYVEIHLPQHKQDRDSGAQSGQPTQEGISGKDEDARLHDEEECIELEAGNGERQGDDEQAGQASPKEKQTTPPTSARERWRKHRLVYVALGVLALAAVFGGLYAYISNINQRGVETSNSAGKKAAGAVSPSSGPLATGNENTNNARPLEQNSNDPSKGNISIKNPANITTRPPKRKAPPNESEAQRQKRAMAAFEAMERQQRAMNASKNQRPVNKPIP